MVTQFDPSGRGDVMAFGARHIAVKRISACRFITALICFAMLQYSGIAWTFELSEFLLDHHTYLHKQCESSHVHLTNLIVGDDPDDGVDEEDLPAYIFYSVLEDCLVFSSENAWISALPLASHKDQLLAFSRTVSLLI
jgi:hypothetical protein